jgi:hypothetical protein
VSPRLGSALRVVLPSDRLDAFYVSLEFAMRRKSMAVPSFCLWYYTADPTNPWEGPFDCNCDNQCQDMDPPAPPNPPVAGFVLVACSKFPYRKKQLFHLPAGWSCKPYTPKRKGKTKTTPPRRSK